MTSTYLPKTHHAISNIVQCSMVFLIISFAHRITKDSHWKLDILIRYAFKKNMFWRVYLHTGMHSVQISCTARSQIIINIFCCVEILKHVIWFMATKLNFIPKYAICFPVVHILCHEVDAKLFKTHIAVPKINYYNRYMYLPSNVIIQ